MLQRGDRLTLPASGERGDWIVKFPDSHHQQVPRNEFAMMSWARLIGIDAPDVRLHHRDELADLPGAVWPNREEYAFAVRRFDRAPSTRAPIHIEDLAQVRGFHPDQKYAGSFESIAALVYRRRDGWSLAEFTRRLVFALLRTRRFEAVRLTDFTSLARRLRAEGVGLEEHALHTARTAIDTWPPVRRLLFGLPEVQAWIDQHLPAMAAQLGNHRP